MASVIVRDDVAILDVVLHEITREEDELSLWLESVKNKHIIKIRNPEYISNYSQVLQYIQESPYYKDQALREWSADGYADPWLIAVAMSTGAVIVTREALQGPINLQYPSKRAKIPDIARHFGVRCETPYQFIIDMHFKL